MAHQLNADMMSNQQASYRVGVIGVGEISHWHVRALQAAGLSVTAVAAREGSRRLEDFASHHRIPKIWPDWRRMLEEPALWDALLIATPPDATPGVLEAALPLQVPILVEKPVARSAPQLAALCAQTHSQVIVGYNRRFYRPVERAREEVRQGSPLMAHLSLPEQVDSGVAERRDWLAPFFDNSCHGIDLLRFLFGELRVEHVRHLTQPDGHRRGFVAVLCNRRGDCVQLTANWGAPANCSLILDRPGRRFELRPFEEATVYEGMEVLPPSDAVPIRRYRPRVVERIGVEEVDHREKPGFVQQALALRRMMEGQPPPPEAATLEDARAAIELCEELVGSPAPGAVQAEGGVETRRPPVVSRAAGDPIVR